MIAVKGVWLDRHEAYFNVYRKERIQYDDLIENFISIEEEEELINNEVCLNDLKRRV